MNFEETIAGRIILTVGCDCKSDDEAFAGMDAESRAVVKARLDVLHLAKIDMADEVLVLDEDGYIGESTRREIEYAKSKGKRVRYYSRGEYGEGWNPM